MDHEGAEQPRRHRSPTARRRETDQDLTAREETTTTQKRRLEVLDVDECMRLLATQRVGRLAYVKEGQPDVVPFNYLFHEGAVVIRTAWGDLLDHLHHQRVAFEVDEVDGAKGGGWSVVIHGLAEEVWRGDELARVRKLPLDPWAPGERDHYLAISPQNISGRRIADPA